MAEKQKLLELSHVYKSFPGVQALCDVRLTLEAGTVHALVGENGAGKSTLMKCLFGMYHADEGTMLLDGNPISFVNTRQALEHGISMVHQELNQVPKLRVMDNIWLGRFPEKGLSIDESYMTRKTQEIFDDFDMAIDPAGRVENLSVSERQMIEIAKAASQNARVIVMDEPTSSLTEKEVKHLFQVIEKLKQKQCGIIYISHKMDEILQIADMVTVMRDGKWIATEPAATMTKDTIITLMVGRELKNLFPPKTNAIGSSLMVVEHLNAVYEPLLSDVSFTLHKGEILGIAGLEGSKRTELVETIFGVRKRKSGMITLHGKECRNNHSRISINNGFSLLTEERKFNGIFEGLSVSDNAIIANIDAYCSYGGVLNEKKMNRDTNWVIDSMRVKTPSQKTLIRNLSGGNQQKVILGRWLLTNPEVLLLDEPTRGIDVGAKYEIYQLIIELASRGKGIVMISSEMMELLGIADRIMVMSNGKIAGIVDAKKTSQEEILKLSAAYL